MNKEYYKEYYFLERNHWWFKARQQLLETQVSSLTMGTPATFKILNVGIATGATSQMLEKFGQVTSIEFDKDCCEFVRKELGLEVIQGSITELPFPDAGFDLVCAFDVVEHVMDEKKAIKEMSRVCKEKGHVFVTVPAFMSLWSEHDEINQHFKRYRLKELQQLFSGNGKITFSSYFNSFLFLPILFARKVSNLFPRKKKVSDFKKFKTGLLNNILKSIFLFENSRLSKKKSFAFGVSILLIWKKTGLI